MLHTKFKKYAPEKALDLNFDKQDIINKNLLRINNNLKERYRQLTRQS